MDEPRGDLPYMGGSYGMPDELGPDYRSWPEIVAAMGSGRSWWLSTTRPDGRPHTMPVWGVSVQDRLVFSTDPGSVKAKNLARDDRAVVHLESGDDVVIIEANVGRIPAERLPDGFAEAYEAKYGIELDLADAGFAWFELAPAKAFSWDESAFVETAVRWRFGASGA